jgi:FkbM family methyltransferase
VSTVAAAPDGRIVALGVGTEKAAIRVHAAPSDPGERPRLDRTTTDWLLQHVRVGDVLCDVNAGIGLYSILAAKQRGAVVIAFEPGYAAFKQLCDNLVLNGCEGTVMAVPLALWSDEGLGELKFPSDGVGEDRHALRHASWRERRPSRDGRTVVQTVCVTSLDRALARYDWPSPQHLRLAETASAQEVLEGAATLLMAPSLRTIFLTIPEDAADGIAAQLGPLGWSRAAITPISRGRAHLLLARRADTSS